MIDINRFVDAYTSRAKTAKGGYASYLHAMRTRWQLWHECQQKALKEFNRIILSNPEYYGPALPGSLKRAANEAGRKARAKFIQDVLDEAKQTGVSDG